MNLQSDPPDDRYLETIIRDIDEHFPGHPNLASAESIRYLRGNLKHCAEYVGSYERLCQVFAAFCADSTARGIQKKTLFANSKSFGSYLLGALKRGLESEYLAAPLGKAIPVLPQQPTSVIRLPAQLHEETSAHIGDEQDIEDEDDISPYERYWRERIEAQGKFSTTKMATRSSSTMMANA